MSIEFNPFSESYRRNPYDIYRRLREEDPVHRSTVVTDGWPEQWIISRYADVMTALRNKALSRDVYEAEDRGITTGYDADSPLWGVMKHWVTVRDGKEHSRLRKQVNTPFSSRAMEGQRERIREIAEMVFDRIAGRGRIDFMADFASPFASAAIADVIGIPAVDVSRFKSAFAHISDAADVDQRPGVLRQANDAVVAVGAYLRETMSRRSLGGLLGGMMHDESVEGPHEAAAAIAFFLTAGHENIANMICNSIVALLRFPDQVELLRSRPELLPDAVNELVRYDTPVQTLVRYAFEDAEIGGVTIRSGERVAVLLGSANRDPLRFAEPDKLDITRDDNKHVSFGFGLHSCIGVAMAKLDCEIVLGMILDRIPGITLAVDEIDWKQSASTRGPVTLPVEF
jgi:cytochrome P450